MKKVKLTNVDDYSLVDDEDYDKVMLWKWAQNKAGYVQGWVHYRDGSKKKYRLHRWLINAPVGVIVDHIDQNTLNNCKSNLRLCTHAQNICNRKKYIKNATSMYMGVGRHKIQNKFNPKITKDGLCYSLGHYDDEEYAAKIRDCAAIKLHGEFAKLNFPNYVHTQEEKEIVEIQLDKKRRKYSIHYQGVAWDYKYKKWVSYIGYNHKAYHLGRFDSEIEAAELRDCAAIVLHKQYAILNFPNKEYTQDQLDKVQESIDIKNQRVDSSQYKGVSFRYDKWKASIRRNDKHYHLGVYSSEIEAAKTYDVALLILYPGKKHLVNFINNSYDENMFKRVQGLIDDSLKRTYGSNYRGVTKHKTKNFDKYRACIEVPDSTKKKGFRKISLGLYANEEDAAKAYDAAAYVYDRTCARNFEENDLTMVEKMRKRKNGFRTDGKGSSRFFGVSRKPKNKNWAVGIGFKGKRIHIGTYKTEKEAALAYNKKAKELLGNKAKLNIIC